MGRKTHISRRQRFRRDLVYRWEGNPVITTDDLPFPCLDIRDAGVAVVDGNYVLLVTIEALDGRTRMFRAESRDGHEFKVHPEPVLAPADKEPFFEHEVNGIEDPRITYLDGVYYVVYTANSPLGLRLGLARTSDFRSFERVALISEPDTKHGTLFPEKFGGRYARLERPRDGGSIWVSYSDDLLYWGGMHYVMGPRHGFWDFHRIGPGTPPMRVEEGWLIIYYGVKETSAGPLIRLGSAILDGDEPHKLLGRSDVPVLTPEEDYERIGDVDNLVFTCGAVLEEKDRLRLFYGGADSCINVGTASAKRIVQRCIDMNGERAEEQA
jgi:predicted GH43/DUF377 family glycosyl hydrolase